jgi:hypothetical protein
MSLKKANIGVRSLDRSYLSKDFESLKLDLLEHVSIYYPEKIRDFSEPSVGGLLMDLAALVGDSMSFYMDHQFREMDPLQSVEPDNIEMHLRNAGVKVYSASPATVELTVKIKAPAENINSNWVPKLSCLPVILKGTEFSSDSGVVFNLLEDLYFSKRDVNQRFLANFTVDSYDNEGNPAIFNVSLNTIAISGFETVDAFSIDNAHVPFRELTLTNENVSEIISVVDSQNNPYYEVESLSQDTVFVDVDNSNSKKDLVAKNMEILPAPRRFVSYTSPKTRKTTLRFGSGNVSSLDDDVIPDPSELSLSLYGKSTLSRFSIDPNLLLQSQTLGISPKNTTVVVRYRHGGGLLHNVDANSITNIPKLSIDFRNNPKPNEALFVRRNITVDNLTIAKGGLNAPTYDDLRLLIPSAKNAQSRIVTRQDLLSRIYSMPSRFGKAYRVSISNNPANPLAILIYLVSLNSEGKLDLAPDAYKLNLSTYLNEFRLISDAYDILDARVINYTVSYEVYLDKKSNKQQSIIAINNNIANALDKKFFHIDQPLIVDDISYIIMNSPGVISISNLKVVSRFGTLSNRKYSNYNFNFEANTKKGIIRGPVGSIFEMRYPEYDIIGSAI